LDDEGLLRLYLGSALMAYLKTSVAGRLEEFLLANPDEELTFRDMQSKFDCSIAALSRAVCQLRESGVLEDVPRMVRCSKEYR
jgi:hypothetical protein